MRFMGVGRGQIPQGLEGHGKELRVFYSCSGDLLESYM